MNTSNRLQLLTLWVSAFLAHFALAADLSQGAAAPASRKPLPVIDVTDLYHPPQDFGDNFDLLAAYALPEVDLRAVVLDCTGVFRAPVAKDPGPGLATDDRGPREPGFIPVWQLNYLFNRAVPCAAGPFTRLKSAQDKMVDVPAFQQQGVELILDTLKRSTEPVHILSFGSARPIAAAFNRDPALFRAKVARIHLCAGASAAGHLEWNVALDRQAIVCLLRNQLPVALYPCAADNARDVGYGIHSPAHSYDSHNTYYKLPNLQFIPQMQPQLRRYLEFAFTRAVRVDFLRALDEDANPPLEAKLLSKEHYVWETGVWICVTGRRLVRHADGHYRIVRPEEVVPTDTVLPNELHPCRVQVADDGIYSFVETNAPSPCAVYFRGDPHQNEHALQEALPALYRSFTPPASASPAR
jgi:pyrimidine-specific ribonucleoside hydrolase